MSEHPRWHMGLIGFGALGRQVHSHFAKAGFRFTLLTRREASDIKPQDLPTDAEVVSRLEDFIGAKPDVAVEMAGQEAVRQYVSTILSTGIPTIVSSVGAFSDENVREWITAAESAGAKAIIPGGAVGGLDYIRTVAAVPGATVTHTSRKPVAAWKQELTDRGISALAMVEPVVLFEGDASSAARLFPRNLNAATSIALASHPAALMVRALVDPAATSNTHEIEVRRAAGAAFFRFENPAFAGNPKTSVLTALSICAEIRVLISGLGQIRRSHP